LGHKIASFITQSRKPRSKTKEFSGHQPLQDLGNKISSAEKQIGNEGNSRNFVLKKFTYYSLGAACEVYEDLRLK